MFAKETILNDRYILQEKLSDNSMRQTWLAKDKRSQQLVILKLLVFGTPMQWRDLNLFEREAKILQQLNNDRIPKYIDYFTVAEDYNYFALVQAYIPGESLQNKLDRGTRFTEDNLRSFAEQILEILSYLHLLNPPVLHRDIKPSNIVLGEDNLLYLIDFGAVQIQAPTAPKSFTVVGTYGYTPIEQFGGKSVPASDIYALGCSLIHLATGVTPAELPQKQGRIDFRSLTNLDRNFIEWLEWLSDPIVDKRPSSAKIALETLKTKSLRKKNESFTQKIAKSISNVLNIKPDRLFFAAKFGLDANKPPNKSKILFARSEETANITIPPVFLTKDLFNFIPLLIWSFWVGSQILNFSTLSPIASLIILLALLFYLGLILVKIDLFLDKKCLSIIYEIMGFNFTLLKIPKEKITKLNFILNRKQKRAAIAIECKEKKYILTTLGRCSLQEKAWIILILSQWSNLPVTDKSRLTNINLLK